MSDRYSARDTSRAAWKPAGIMKRLLPIVAAALCFPLAFSPALAAEETAPAVEEVAIMDTSEGEIVIGFWPDVAPKTVANFKKLASEKFYDGTAFHRILAGFMAQGGDPLTKDESKEMMWGTGDPGYKIEAEFNDRKHERGVMSMARSNDPNSAGSQFFLMLGNAPHLDGAYTAFGKMIKGEETLAKIAATPVVPNAGGEPSKPTKRVEIKSVRIVPKSEVE